MLKTIILHFIITTLQKLNIKIILLAFALISLPSYHLLGQDIKISREINVKNDLAYDILPNIDGKVFFYRDKGDEYFFDIFDSNLDFIRSTRIDFDVKRVVVDFIAAQDTCVKVFYEYKKDQVNYLKVKTYDNTASLVDTLTLINTLETLPSYGLKTTISEDKSKILFFGQVKKQLYLFVFDITKNEVLFQSRFSSPEVDIREDFRKIVLSNEGEVFVLFESNNNRYDKEYHNFYIFSPKEEDDFDFMKINSSNILNTGICFDIDNKNGTLNLVGLGGIEESEITGYFQCIIPKMNVLGIDTLALHPFDSDLSGELYGSGKKHKIRDYEARDLIFTHDGACVLISEMKKEYTRRSTFPGRFDGESYAQRGFIDHYNEDILVFNIRKDGSLAWRKVLYKKQFSQDDDGAFSSFFTFKTPSRIRLIYNDEIKSNSTVSEYVLDPLGNFERNTLFNTDYQNLKLRFINAVQTGSDELIVPSEKSYKINLVKLKY